MSVAAPPGASSGLFARKGGALPACSERLVKRPAGRARPANAGGEARESEPAGEAASTPPDASTGAPKSDATGAPTSTLAGAPAGEPTSVLSIDLRAALVSLPVADREAAPVPPKPAIVPPPPVPEGNTMAGPLIAAVVAVCVAAGLFYAFGVERPEVAPLADAPEADAPAADAPEAEAPAEVAAGTAEDAGDAEAGTAAGAGSGEVTDEEADRETDATAEAEGTLPSFDLVRVERDGAAVIAGRAAPYAELILLHNGEPIGKATADWAGEWAFVADQPLPADKHTISVLVNDPDAEITLPDGADPPAQMSDSLNSSPR